MHSVLISALMSAQVVTATQAVHDDFKDKLDPTLWTTRIGLNGGQVSCPIADSQAGDGSVLELVYPGKSSPRKYGPRYSSEIERVVTSGYGSYSARLKTASATGGAGVVSAFFTYFNDGSDADNDGMADNSEIDFEFLAAEPSMIYITLWTDYAVINGVEKFYHTARKVDLATGRVWQTEPGFEGAYGHLVEVAGLGWSIPGFDASQAYKTYGFQWDANRVTYWFDAEDGKGPRTLWDFNGQANVSIPSRPAYAMFNLWHNNSAWDTGQSAPPPSKDVRMRVDWTSLP